MTKLHAAHAPNDVDCDYLGETYVDPAFESLWNNVRTTAGRRAELVMVRHHVANNASFDASNRWLIERNLRGYAASRLQKKVRLKVLSTGEKMIIRANDRRTANFLWAYAGQVMRVVEETQSLVSNAMREGGPAVVGGFPKKAIVASFNRYAIFSRP